MTGRRLFNDYEMLWVMPRQALEALLTSHVPEGSIFQKHDECLLKEKKVVGVEGGRGISFCTIRETVFETKGSEGIRGATILWVWYRLKTTGGG